jgi:hypothetical protein
MPGCAFSWAPAPCDFVHGGTRHVCRRWAGKVAVGMTAVLGHCLAPAHSWAAIGQSDLVIQGGTPKLGTLQETTTFARQYCWPFQITTCRPNLCCSLLQAGPEVVLLWLCELLWVVARVPLHAVVRLLGRAASTRMDEALWFRCLHSSTTPACTSGQVLADTEDVAKVLRCKVMSETVVYISQRCKGFLPCPVPSSPAAP